MAALHDKIFKSDFTTSFKGEESGDRTPRQTPGVLYSLAAPTPVSSPQLIGWSSEMASEMDLSYPDRHDLEILAGNKVTPIMKPYAACYAGHQFGQWAGQLGDGRAITLGELDSKKGILEVQLKGAGPTVYSRRADGRAVLRSSVREYLMSEAMYHLNVPTTRALSLVTTGEKVLRDMFYDGNPAYEPGAIVTRIAPSFLRFGNFEILAAQKDRSQMQELIDWSIQRFSPHIEGENKVLDWFKEIVTKTAHLMVEWHRVGFVHGVMNTDNMSILGLTIDYGPFSFLDNYDPEFTPNTTDLPGRRYAFGNQASVAYWNLGRLANAISILLPDTEELEEALGSYEDEFWNSYFSMMGKKLGLDTVNKEDKELITRFEKTLTSVQPDMTLFYRSLISVPDLADTDPVSHFEACFYNKLDPSEEKEFRDLIRDYLTRMRKNSIPGNISEEIMKRNNPRIILRNYLLHEAAEKLEKGDDSLFLSLQEALKVPYSDKGFEELTGKRPAWAEKKAGCSMLSCSS
ncbi:protein adenylyltransferase SelO [Salinimicrobium gaetbulicola]|uniref:Protein nucleotidyltransferase YdiU n=1 Tax=Salinimicrobium gaetbulicola TaxID=999702 RepID=A0ABW3IEX1_9FLAO